MQRCGGVFNRFAASLDHIKFGQIRLSGVVFDGPNLVDCPVTIKSMQGTKYEVSIPGYSKGNLMAGVLISGGEIFDGTYLALHQSSALNRLAGRMEAIFRNDGMYLFSVCVHSHDLRYWIIGNASAMHYYSSEDGRHHIETRRGTVPTATGDILHVRDRAAHPALISGSSIWCKGFALGEFSGNFGGMPLALAPEKWVTALSSTGMERFVVLLLKCS
jgi:hypothetical protein